jgi:hypothetical protein
MDIRLKGDIELFLLGCGLLLLLLLIVLLLLLFLIKLFLAEDWPSIGVTVLSFPLLGALAMGMYLLLPPRLATPLPDVIQDIAHNSMTWFTSLWQ